MDNKLFDKLRLPLAIFLSLLVCFIYLQYVKHNTPPLPDRPPYSDDGEVPPRSGRSDGGKSSLFPSKQKTSLADIQEDLRLESRLVVLSNEKISLTLTSINAAIATNLLRNQNLVSGVYDLEAGGDARFLTGVLSFSRDLETPSDPIPYAVGQQTSNAVTFTGRTQLNDGEIVVEKKYTLEDHHLNLTLSIASLNNTTIEGQFFLLNGSSIGREHPGPKSYFDTTTLSYTSSKNENINAMKPHWYSSQVDRAQVNERAVWIAIDNRFYLKALKPLQPIYSSEFRQSPGPGRTNYMSAYRVPFRTTQAFPFQARFQYSFLPKNRILLNDIADQQGDFFYLIFRQWAWMKTLTDIMYYLFIQLDKLVGNVGWSIVLMGISIKLLTYPLTQKSYRSMKKMRDLAPKVEALRAKYKKNSQKIQLETMNLYRREKVNPASGCLPMLIPIPVFIAMYVLFQNMNELNNASFLWMDNLAMADRFLPLPLTLPFLGDSFNLIAFLTSLSQFFMSFLTPQPATNETARLQAKMIKYFFPIFFLFICWNLPSALVLFWFVQNLFSIAQTMFTEMNKKKETSNNNKVKIGV